jgi:hypothetical protein
MTILVRRVSDVIDVGDNRFNYTRNLSETTLTSESILIHQYLGRTIQDTISLNEFIDTPEVGIRRVAISDTTAIVELVLRHTSTKILITNSIVVSETIDRLRKLIRNIENWLGRIRYRRHISNTTTVSESIFTRVEELKHLISDTTTLDESLDVNVITNPTEFIRLISDTKTLSESINRHVRHSRAASDSLEQKFDPNAGDIFYGRKKVKAEPKKEEEPITVQPTTRSLLGGHIRRRHRMRSI